MTGALFFVAEDAVCLNLSLILLSGLKFRDGDKYELSKYVAFYCATLCDVGLFCRFKKGSGFPEGTGRIRDSEKRKWRQVTLARGKQDLTQH